MNYGKKVWIFPDAELPPEGVNLIPGHESVIVTNVTDQKAVIKVTLIYTDKEPAFVPTKKRTSVHLLPSLKSSMPSCWKAMCLLLPSTEEQNPEPSISIQPPATVNDFNT